LLTSRSSEILFRRAFCGTVKSTKNEVFTKGHINEH
jgi:hypothetical protein